MKKYDITVTKLTDIELLRRAAAMTTGKDSKMTLRRAYMLGHSLSRTQLFWIEFHDIPLSVMGHLVRHIHAQPYVLSKRPDRGGASMEAECNSLANKLTLAYSAADDDYFADMCFNVRFLFDRFGRNSPTSMALLINAEEIINISRVRLCNKASKETMDVWNAVVNEIANVDPDLFSLCVANCVHQGFCRERPCCGFIKSDKYNELRNNYLKLFSE